MSSLSKDNVLDLIQSKKLYYKDKGKDYLINCMNPEHDDEKPSCFVHKETGKFHCFSCGHKGNLFRVFGVFVSPIRDLLYNVKQSILALQSQSVGLEIPKTSVPFEEDFRGISKQSFIDHEAFIDADPEYVGRVLFPIKDSTGKIVLFNGRKLESKTPPKYKYFPAGVPLPVFPTYCGTSYVILVEGFLDYLNLYDKGMKFVSTTFGTNSLSEQIVEEKLVFQVMSGVTLFVILFDNDKAGRDGAYKVSQAIESKLRIKTLVLNHLLPNNGDPGALNAMEVQILDRKIKKLIEKEG